MTMMRIRIRKLDDGDPPHVELLISYGDFAARQDSYIYDEEILQFGVALRSFPECRARSNFREWLA